MASLLLNFPDGFTPNSSQVTILNKMEKAFDEGYKFVVCNASTGSGKSFLGKTLANYSNDAPEDYLRAIDDYTIFGEDGHLFMNPESMFGCYALTITKSLQDQYKNTFDDTGVLKGQSNHPCAIDDTLSVDIAPCRYVKGLKNDCWNKNICPYYNQRNNMLKSKFAALNYSMFFSLPDHLKKRTYIVCDEGSELEQQLVSQFTCEVDIPFLVRTNTVFTSFPSQETPTKVLTWIGNLLGGINKNVEAYKDWFKDHKNDKLETSKKKGEYTKLLNLQGSLEILIDTFHDSQYIIVREDRIIKFIPLKVDKLSKFIFDYAEHVVIMSATIIDHPNFCKTLGIGKYKYIEVDSTFNHEKAPIHILVKQKLNFKNMKEMLPKLAAQVTELLNVHENEKGIIHTHTQFIVDYIRNHVKSDRLLCRGEGVKNESLLDTHSKTTYPSVLVSPSMTYGVDLKGDLATFQILLKAPWLPTKDPRIEKMMKLDKSWYSNKMLCSVVQACGRGIRSDSDECVTYILDGSVYDTIERNQSKLPKYFVERLQ